MAMVKERGRSHGHPILMAALSYHTRISPDIAGFFLAVLELVESAVRSRMMRPTEHA